MANRWGNNRNSNILYFLGFPNHCSHEIKRRKAMTNLDSILKSRDNTLVTKIHIVETMVFPIVMYKCESWTIKKAEHQRIDSFPGKEFTCSVRNLGLISLLSKGLKSLLQHHSSKTSILWCSAFFMVQLSYPYMTTGKTIALTTQIFMAQ